MNSKHSQCDDNFQHFFFEKTSVVKIYSKVFNRRWCVEVKRYSPARFDLKYKMRVP